MKIIFFGTSIFAVPSLEALIKSKHEVLVSVTQPDRPKGRSGIPSPPPVKQAAKKYNIKILQPERLDQQFFDKIRSLEADLLVVVAYGHILKKELLDIPRICSVNVHASLLPKYRGAAPINRAIINGETKTGITIIRMNERLDEGDIISSSEVNIDPDDNSLSLGEKLSREGSQLLLKTIENIKNDIVDFKKQDPLRASYARKLSKEEGLIDWQDEAVRIHNKVRGLLPWPSAYTHYGNKILKILKTETLGQKTGNSGEIIKAEGDDFIVGTGLGAIKILELQLEGSKSMDAASFLRGHNVAAGHILGVKEQ